MRSLAVACALSLLPAHAAAAADRPWIEVTSPHFTAVSEVGDKTTRDALWAFEQMRVVIQKLFPWAGVDPNRPIVLVLPKGENGMRELLPYLAEQKATYTPSSSVVYGADRYYIAFRADVT